jgi:hypothetical protein
MSKSATPPSEAMMAQMEPLAVAACDENFVSLASIAISLKRIADTMDGSATGICITETLIGGQAHGR